MRKLLDILRNPKITLLIVACAVLIGNSFYALYKAIQEFRHPHIRIVEMASEQPAHPWGVPYVHWAAPRTSVPMTATHDMQQSMPAPMMNSTSYSILQTSNAAPTIVNTGGNGPIAMASSNNSSNNGRRTGDLNASVSMTGMIYLNTAHIAMTSVGAKQANEVVNEKMGIVTHRQGEPDPPSEPTPDLDDPTPVGATPWIVMLLLAGGYAAYQTLRRKSPQSKEISK